MKYRGFVQPKQKNKKQERQYKRITFYPPMVTHEEPSVDTGSKHNNGHDKTPDKV